MRLIDADALRITMDYQGTFAKVSNPYLEALIAVQRFINNAPTVDAVEVVRCKDCIYFMPKANGTVGFCKCGETVGHHPMMRVAMDFCSYGERRKQNDRPVFNL